MLRALKLRGKWCLDYTMIDFDLANRFSILLPIKIPISIGGNLGEAQGCIIHKIKLRSGTSEYRVKLSLQS